MFSSLIAGVSAPSWDREVFQAIQDCLLGLPRGQPPKMISLLNGFEQVYRSVVADGAAEYEALLSCLVARGFEIRTHGNEVWATLPELSSAALKV